MRIAIRENYIDTTSLTVISEEELRQPPYNFSFCEIPDDKEDCMFEDFDFVSGEYLFNLNKYNARKESYIYRKRIIELKNWFDNYFQLQLIQSMWQKNFIVTPDPFFKDSNDEFLTYNNIEELKNKGEEVRAEIKNIKNMLENN